MDLGRTLTREGPPPTGGAAPATALSAPRLYPPRTRAGLDPTRREEFVERLGALRRAYLALGQGPGSSSLQILDLGQIRLRFGRRWLPSHDKIMGIVEASIQRELGRDEAYVAAGETLVYLFRVGLPRKDADRRGRLLAADVTERLCGAIPGGVAVALKTAPFDFNQGLSGIASFEQLRNRIEAFDKAVDDHEMRLFIDLSRRMEPWFSPALHVRKRLISAYRLLPLVAPAAGGAGAETGRESAAPRPVQAFCPASFGGVFEAEVDNWAIQQAGQALAAPGGGSRRRALLIAPVRYETLAAMRFRDPYLILCRQLPPGSSRRLILEVLDLPPGLPQSRVRELMAYVKPFCRGMIARLGREAIHAEHLANSGIVGVSLDLAGLDPDALAARQAVQALAEAARAQRMRSLLVDAASARLCNLAMRARVDHVEGPGFLPPSRQLGPATLIQR